MNTRMRALPKSTKFALYGLGVGILGLLIQWIVDPSKFPLFPPGIIVIAVCAALVAFGRRWWSPIFAPLVAAWILVGGILGEDLTQNLTSGDPGTVVGNIVMCLGLGAAAIAGVSAMVYRFPTD
ncbi:hypothetical protein [Nocardia sp. XZ_19_385]|uniref:hypothetical protein n=1 Tax=Nocardia sp. XZ_19_385 TaxID=2769488 RepID=UPI00189002BD|nr:hypothetical protein [Nocardia sp. XZ_19_385]